MYKLENKKILISGASKGLGYVCARAFADEGAHLVIAARSMEQLEQLRESLPNSERHMSFAADLTQSGKISELVETGESFLGNFDVIMHVAGGGLGLRDPLLTLEDFRKLYELNVGIAVGINRLIIPRMIEKGYGNVVHVCSIASTEATGSVGYNMSKAALAAYVRSLGREIADTGVIVTGILPGAFLAPQNAFVRLSENNPVAYKNFIEARLPRKHVSRAKEIVPLLLFLSSSAASMMSGCCVPIDAGEGVSYLIQ
ncbi:TPA: SDR family oxidoreductase [Candidatus Poribacteria bacterium]|nr:SDR family oxidoreductase [Candidatus Poribacteria bacterium]